MLTQATWRDLICWYPICCTFSGGVPTMLIAILQHPDYSTYDLSSLKQVTCAGAPVPVALMEQVKEQIGADVCILFGQTETSPIIATSNLWTRIP